MLMIFEVSQLLAAKVRFRHAHHIRSKRTTRFVDANGTQLLSSDLRLLQSFHEINPLPSLWPFAVLCLNLATLLMTVFSSLFYVASSPLLQSGALWQTLDQLLQKWIAIQLRHRPSKCYLEGFCYRSWTFWHVLSSLFLWKKHRKGSCCFFRTLDRTWRNIKAIWPSFSHKKLALKNFCWRFNELWIRLILFKCCSWQPRNAEHLGVPMKTTVRKEVRKH